MKHESKSYVEGYRVGSEHGHTISVDISAKKRIIHGIVNKRSQQCQTNIGIY